ncbi:MAG: DUF2849 domain-containing protein [Hydrotalea sp.]|nr:DUF2849 domain-containing protein [Hydrotalea sp.]
MSNNINVITANRLDDGLVVYFQSANPENKWTLDVQSASKFSDDDLPNALVEAKKNAAQVVVGIYDFPVVVSEGGKIMTLSAKEEIRARHKPTIGPSA